jgi:N-methylhydantoinase B
MNTPIEAIELEYPVRIENYGFIIDSGGAGKYRGALALRRDIRFLVDKVSFARYGDSQEIGPFGLFGGHEGSKGRFILNPGTDSESRLKSKDISSLKINDVVSLRLPGGGGYGNPEERNNELVENDLKDGKISSETAANVYKLKLKKGKRRK